jgi:glycosyltransferase involved in cell wall biosynthesis
MADQNSIHSDGLSIVLGTYNRQSFLKQTIESIRRELANATFSYEIIVIDGGSTDGTLQWLTRQKDIITIIQHNRGTWNGKVIERKSWGYFMNLGFKSAQGKYICMLSDDCLVVPGAILNGYYFFESELQRNMVKIGALAFYFRNWPIEQKYHIERFCGITNINHGLYLKEALIKVDFADEDAYRFYWGDVDISYKLIKGGYNIEISKNSFIEHFLHTTPKIRSSNIMLLQTDTLRFINKWDKEFPNIDLKSQYMPLYVEDDFVDKYQTVKIWRRIYEVKFFLIYSSTLGFCNKLIKKEPIRTFYLKYAEQIKFAKSFLYRMVEHLK